MSIHSKDVARHWRAIGAVTAAAVGLTAGAAHAAPSTTAAVHARVLDVVGTAHSDRLALRLDGATPNILVVDVGADGTPDFSFDRTTFTAIDVDARGGEDTLIVDRSGGLFLDERVTLDGGGGSDTFIGGDGDDVLIGGDGADQIDGNRGNDAIFAGNGADNVTWDPGDGSDVVEGEKGDDSLLFNGSNAGEQTDLSANAARVRLFRNVGGVTMDLDGIEGVDLRMLGGTDAVTVGDLDGTDLETTNVNLAATDGDDDGDIDTVVANGTAGPDAADISSSGNAVVLSGLGSEVQVTGGAPNDGIGVATQAGDDVVTTGIGVAGTAALTADGGLGSDRLLYSGTAQADSIFVGPSSGTVVRTTAPASAPADITDVERLGIIGDRGADVLTAGNGIATRTSLTLDGGSGADIITGGDGADLLTGGSGDDTVRGGRGNDDSPLGGGADHFVWGPGDGSDTVEGQAGNDTLDFDGSNIGEKIDVSASGSRVRLFRDVAAVTMDLGTVEDLNVRVLGGADEVTVSDLTGTDLRDAEVDLFAVGGVDDLAADTVILNGSAARDDVRITREDAQVLTKGLAAVTRIAGSVAATDTLKVNTLAGNDRVELSGDVLSLITPVIDLGTDQS